VFFENFLRSLLSLPQKPLVMVVLHCHLQQLSARPNALSKRGFSSKGDRIKFEAEKVRAKTLAHHYSLPVVSGCSAIDQLYDGSCLDEAPIDDESMLMAAFYAPGDKIHYNRAAMGMEGCLLSDLVANGHLVEEDSDELPTRLGRVSDALKTIWANSTMRDSFNPQLLNGFTRQQGGRGGNKVWYENTEDNASLTFETKPATHLALVYYMHPELPMGVVRVSVDGAVWTDLDACCSKQCEGIPEY